MLYSNRELLNKKGYETKSLMKLLGNRLLQEPMTRVLEAGHGNSSLLHSLKVPKKYAFDKIGSNEFRDGIHFFNHDACTEFPYKDHDLIIDSHLAHCLRNEQEIIDYFTNCFHSLKEGGFLVSQMMIRSKNFELHFAGKDTSMRTILNAQRIEKILLEIGFKIEYFYIPYGRRFILENHLDIDERFHPDVLEFIAKK